MCVPHKSEINDYLIEYLKDAKDINETTSDFGFTALHIVCELYGRLNSDILVRTMEILIDAGANINAITFYGSTPLKILVYHFSSKCNKKNVDVVEMFLLKGAEIFTIKNRAESEKLSVYYILTYYTDYKKFADFTIDEKNKTVIYATGKLTKCAINTQNFVK